MQITDFRPIIISESSVNAHRIKTLEQEFSHFQLEYGKLDSAATNNPLVNAGGGSTATEIVDVPGVKDSDNLYWEMQDFDFLDSIADTTYAFRFRVVDCSYPYRIGYAIPDRE